MSNALAFELSADSAGLDAGLRAAEKKFAAFGGKVSGDLKSLVASFASYEAFKGLIGNTVAASKEIRNFAKQADISTDEVQRLQKAAGIVGLDFEDFQTGLSKLGTARKDAANSNQPLLDFFNRFGISLKDLQDPELRNIDLLTKLSNAMKGVRLTPQEREQFRDVFGKSGEKLIAAMNELARLGKIRLIDEQDLKNIDEAARALEGLLKIVQKFGAPALAGFASTITKGITGQGQLPEQKIIDKLKAGKPPDMNDMLRLAGQVVATGWGPGGYAVGKERGRQLMDFLGFPRQEGPGVDALQNTLAEKQSAKATAKAIEEKALHERTLQEQWAQYAAFIDHTMTLQEHVEKLNFDMLAPKEQQLDLQRRINEELAEAARLSKINPVEAQNRKIKAAELNEKLFGMIGHERPMVPTADSAASAGGFIGGAVNFNPQNFEGREQTRLLEDVRDNTARIADKIQPPPKPSEHF